MLRPRTVLSRTTCFFVRECEQRTTSGAKILFFSCLVFFPFFRGGAWFSRDGGTELAWCRPCHALKTSILPRVHSIGAHFSDARERSFLWGGAEGWRPASSSKLIISSLWAPLKKIHRTPSSLYIFHCVFLTPWSPTCHQLDDPVYSPPCPSPRQQRVTETL